MISASARLRLAEVPDEHAVEVPDDEPRVARELVAHRLGRGDEPARRVGERAGARVVDDERAQLVAGRREAHRAVVAGEAGLRRRDARRRRQQHAQRRHAGLARRRLELVAPVQDDPQEPRDRLRALRVAPEPPEVLRDARRDERAGTEPRRRRPALQPEARRALGLGREHPGVLAHRAGRRRDAPAAAVRRHARQPAGHDDVRRPARDRERAQHAAAQLDAVAGQRRRALGRRGRLADPAGRPGLDAGAERLQLAGGRLPAEHRPVAADRRRGPQHELGRGARGRTRAPPGRRTTSSAPRAGAAGGRADGGRRPPRRPRAPGSPARRSRAR